MVSVLPARLSTEGNEENEVEARDQTSRLRQDYGVAGRGQFEGTSSSSSWWIVEPARERNRSTLRK